MESIAARSFNFWYVRFIIWQYTIHRTARIWYCTIQSKQPESDNIPCRVQSESNNTKYIWFNKIVSLFWWRFCCYFCVFFKSSILSKLVRKPHYVSSNLRNVNRWWKCNYLCSYPECPFERIATQVYRLLWHKGRCWALGGCFSGSLKVTGLYTSHTSRFLSFAPVPQ